MNVLPGLPALCEEAHYRIAPARLPAGLRCAVVVPARDEAERVLTCLESIRCQWDQAGRLLGPRVLTVLVVNGTTDHTLHRVRQWCALHPATPVVVVEANFDPARAHVGSARGLGLRIGAAALAAAGEPPAGRQLLFSTDADTHLAHDALARGLDELTRVDAFGAHIVAGEEDDSRVGQVVVRYQALKGRLRRAYYPLPFERGPQHGVFGGAGFGVSRRAYREAGGLPELPYDEDQGMRTRLLESGARVSYPRDVIVYTSTRQDGRTPWGMAKQLAAWAELEADYWPPAPSAAGLRAKYQLKRHLRERWQQSGRIDEFERSWRAHWLSDSVQAAFARRFPEPDLLTAVASLEAELARTGQNAAPRVVGPEPRPAPLVS